MTEIIPNWAPCQFYRPWCKLTGNLGWPKLFPIGPSANSTDLGASWLGKWDDQNCSQLGPAPNSTDLGASWLGTWDDLNCSQLGPAPNSTDLGASWLGTWDDRNCSQLGPAPNSTDLGASWLGTWDDRNCSQLGPAPPKAGPAYNMGWVQHEVVVQSWNINILIYWWTMGDMGWGDDGKCKYAFFRCCVSLWRGVCLS